MLNDLSDLKALLVALIIASLSESCIVGGGTIFLAASLANSIYFNLAYKSSSSYLIYYSLIASTLFSSASYRCLLF